MERVLDDSTPDADAHLQVTLDEVAGYIQDDVAWADGTGRFERDGAITPTRFTCVFRREDGAWRLVQAHSSIAVPNDRMFDAMFRQTRT
jgi:ketosteroid isomerase-like protein